MSSQQTEGGWTLALFSSVFVAFFGCLVSAGFNIGVLNAPQEILMGVSNASVARDFGVVLDTSSLELVWSAVVAVFLVGATGGAMVGGTVANFIGRKMSIMVVEAIFAIAGVLLFIGYEKQHIHWFFLGRILAGLGTERSAASGALVGLTSTVCPLYVHEVAPARLRSALGSATNLGFCVGLLLGQILGLPEILGSAETVQYLLIVFLIPTVSGAVVLPFCPESPKYLFINKAREQDAFNALSRLRGLPQEALSSELSCYRAEAKLAAETPSWSLRRLLVEPDCRSRLLVLVLLCAGQQLSGVNAVFFFSTAIFQRAGLSQSQGALASLGCGAANASLALMVGPCVSRVPLRRLFTASCVGCAVCLAVFAGALSLMETYVWAAVVAVVALILYVVAFASGLGPVPWMLGAEMFEQGPRALAVSIGSATLWVSNFFIVLLFPVMYSQVGVGCFLFFLACCLAAAAVAHFNLPGPTGQGSSEKALEAVQV